MTLRQALEAKRDELEASQRAFRALHGDRIEDGPIGIEFDGLFTDFLLARDLLDQLTRRRESAGRSLKRAEIELREKPGDAEWRALKLSSERTIALLDMIEGDHG